MILVEIIMFLNHYNLTLMASKWPLRVFFPSVFVLHHFHRSLERLHLEKPASFKWSSPLTVIGVRAITLSEQIVLSMLFKLSGLFNLTHVDDLLTLSPSPSPQWIQKVTDTHTHTNTHLLEKYDYLRGRSPLATDLLIERTFFPHLTCTSINHAGELNDPCWNWLLS